MASLFNAKVAGAAVFSKGFLSLLPILASCHLAYADERGCKPAVTTETKSCGSSGKILTNVVATNGCSCDVEVVVEVLGGGSSVLYGIRKNGGVARDMIRTCDDKAGQIASWTAKFSCPKETQEDKPKEETKKGFSAEQKQGPDWAKLNADQQKRHKTLTKSMRRASSA